MWCAEPPRRAILEMVPFPGCRRSFRRSPVGFLLVCIVAISSAGLVACDGSGKPDPARARLRQPTGLAVDPSGRWLFVTNGNWDREQSGGTLMALSLTRLFEALEDPAPPGAPWSQGTPCRISSDDDPVIECDPSRFIVFSQTVIYGDGLGNIAVDRPAGGESALRLLMPQRQPAAIAWADIIPGDDAIRIDCGQDENGRCDEAHRIERAAENPDQSLPPDPSRVVLDDHGFRFAYVPHLVGGSLSLIDLDGERGPELSSVEAEFYRPAPFEDFEERGGFSVVSRVCDPDNPPSASSDCVRPVMLTTHRYWPGIRAFAVAPGLELILPGGDAELAPLGSETVESRPFMGDLQFEDPSTGQSLLVVQTTPNGLARVDVSVAAEGNLEYRVRNVVPVCDNPNLLDVHRPQGEPWLALVTCFSARAMTVVELDAFTVIATLELGAGANEVVVDEQRRLAWVANTGEGTISLVGLDRRSPHFLREWARLGDADRRED